MNKKSLPVTIALGIAVPVAFLALGFTFGQLQVKQQSRTISVLRCFIDYEHDHLAVSHDEPPHWYCLEVTNPKISIQQTASSKDGSAIELTAFDVSKQFEKQDQLQ